MISGSTRMNKRFDIEISNKYNVKSPHLSEYIKSALPGDRNGKKRSKEG
jgi:hypothetical protein